MLKTYLQNNIFTKPKLKNICICICTENLMFIFILYFILFKILYFIIETLALTVFNFISISAYVKCNL